jgi:hypothetical protein
MIELDKSFEIPIYSPVCSLCKHWRMDIGKNGRTCAAFLAPDSIPMVIWRGENNHTQPYPDDHDIQFEAREQH